MTSCVTDRSVISSYSTSGNVKCNGMTCTPPLYAIGPIFLLFFSVHLFFSHLILFVLLVFIKLFGVF